MVCTYFLEHRIIIQIQQIQNMQYLTTKISKYLKNDKYEHFPQKEM